MPYEFGKLLQQWRKDRQLSQNTLARIAEVAPRTLRYWEIGERLPSNMELERVLTSLNATPWEKRRAYDLIPRPRIHELQKKLIPAPDAVSNEALLLPHLGDLLRSMRVRRNKTQEQLAVEMGVSATTLTGWETLRKFPSEENLARLCLTLHATPEETHALTSRRLWLPDVPGKTDLALLEAQFDQMTRLDIRYSPLTELYALTLRRNLSLLAPTFPGAPPLLVRTMLIHATILYWQNQSVNSRVIVAQIGRLLVETQEWHHWHHFLNLSSCFVGKSKQDWLAKAMFLSRNLTPQAGGASELKILSDMALYFGLGQRVEEALRVIDQAEKVLETRMQINENYERDTWYYLIVRARMHMRLGKAEEALQKFREAIAIQPNNVLALVYTAEAALATGEKDQCGRLLQQAADLIGDTHLPVIQRKVKEIGRML